MDIETIQQRAGYARLIILRAFRHAAAGASGFGCVAAPAGIHRGDKLEACRIAHMRIGARDDGFACLDGLTQRIQYLPLELDPVTDAVPEGDPRLPRAR